MSRTTCTVMPQVCSKIFNSASSHADSDCRQSCDLLSSAKHEAQTAGRLFQNDWRVFIGPVAKQFVVHEPHLQYNEYAYALLSELVCFIFSKMLEVTQSKAYSNDSYDCINLTPVGAPIVRRVARCLASIGMLTMLSGVLVAEIFDMDAICNPSTLDVEVLQDWHPVEGEL